MGTSSTAECSLWGWALPARVGLAAFALFCAGVLAVVAPRDVRTPGIDPTLVADPNTAPPEVLTALPRLGPAMVGRIVAERDREPFQSLDDLRARVRGIGPVTTAALRPYLRFGIAESLASRARAHPDE